MLENVFYSISVAIMVMVGTLAFLLGYRPTNAALTITLALGSVAMVSLVAVWWLLRSQPRLLSRFLKHDAVRDAEDRVFRFASRRKERMGRDSAAGVFLSRTAVLEIYFLLTVLAGHGGRTFLMALILSTVERLIMVVFKFVPLRLGVDQVGAGSVAGMIGIGRPTGITIATVRTARNLFWAAVGLVLLGGARAKRKGLQKSAGPMMTVDDGR